MRTDRSGRRTHVWERQGDEDGLSLIELVIVVVILGALIAIGVPLLAGVKGEADQNALAAAAAEGALAVASAIAGDDGEDVDDAASAAGSADVLVFNVGSESDISGVCVRAESSTGAWAQAGSASNCAGNSWTPTEPGG